MAINPAFHGLHAEGPVANESASVRAASRWSRSTVPAASATRSIVTGSLRSPATGHLGQQQVVANQGLEVRVVPGEGWIMQRRRPD